MPCGDSSFLHECWHKDELDLLTSMSWRTKSSSVLCQQFIEGKMSCTDGLKAHNKEKKSKILENFIKNWFCFPFSFIVISADIIFLHYLSFSWSHHQEVVFDRRSEMKFQDNFKMRSMKRESEGKFICLFYFFSIILDGQPWADHFVMPSRLYDWKKLEDKWCPYNDLALLFS